MQIVKPFQVVKLSLAQKHPELVTAVGIVDELK